MDAQLKRGVLEACVLASLLREPSYGYRIVKDVSPHVELSESTLYPILKRLEAGSMVTVSSVEHNGRLRKYYAITDAGRAEIDRFLTDWESVTGVYNYIKEEYENEQGGVS